MQTKEEIQQGMNDIIREFGEWTYDIPLPFDIWTKGNLGYPHTRLRRILQIVSDTTKKPLSECRILDLGCLDGMFSIEFAMQGAETVGVDIREANIKKALFCKEALNLTNLNFYVEDVRKVTRETYGSFDAIICSGLLYHLPAVDAIELIKTMYDIATQVLIIDTHISLLPIEQVLHQGIEYWGDIYREYPDNTTKDEIAKATWSSADNPTSFWFTRPSLVNILDQAGFSSAYECFTPTLLMPERSKFEKNGIEAQDRCTFVGIKSDARKLFTSPAVNTLHEKWPENSLSYYPEPKAPEKVKPRSFSEKLLSLLRNQ